MIYHSKDSEMPEIACLLDGFADPGEDQVEEDIAFFLQRESDGLLVFDSDVKSSERVKEEFEDRGYGEYDARPILWLRPLGERKQFHFKLRLWATRGRRGRTL
jgi:hypothetical protein